MIRNVPKDGKVTQKAYCNLDKKKNLDQAIANMILEVHRNTKKKIELQGKGK